MLQHDSLGVLNLLCAANTELRANRERGDNDYCEHGCGKHVHYLGSRFPRYRTSFYRRFLVHAPEMNTNDVQQNLQTSVFFQPEHWLGHPEYYLFVQ